VANVCVPGVGGSRHPFTPRAPMLGPVWCVGRTVLCGLGEGLAAGCHQVCVWGESLIDQKEKVL